MSFGITFPAPKNTPCIGCIFKNVKPFIDMKVSTVDLKQVVYVLFNMNANYVYEVDMFIISVCNSVM